MTRSCRCCSRRSSRSFSSSVSWRHRDAGGPRHHLGDVVDRDLRHGRLVAAELLDLLPDLGDLVAQLGGPLVLLAGHRLVLVPLQFLGPALQVAHVPAGRLGAQPDPGPGLVDEVDRLVRQEAVGDVPVGQLDRGHQRLVGVAHLVVGFVPVAQPAQDRDRVVHGRLGHQDRLEPAGQRRVLLDVLAVLIQRGRADDVQLTAGQGRLEHVAGVHPALAAAARADQGVQLVDEDDQLIAVLPDLVDEPLHPLLEVAAVPGARDHAGQLELHHPLARQRLRHVLVHDALGDALDDRGLAHPGLADQHRVVLAPAGQHLHGLLDLVVPADHRVDPSLPGQGGQVPAELVQGRCGRPGARPARPAGRPALASQRALQRLRRDPGRGQHPARPGLGVHRQREQDVLGPDVGGADRAGDLVRVQQGALGARRQLRRLAARRAPLVLLLDAGDQRVRVGARPGQQLAGGLQPGRGPQQLLGVQVRAALPGGLRRGRAEQFAGWLAHQPGDVHPPGGLARAARAVDAGEEVIERAAVFWPVETAGHDGSPVAGACFVR